MHSVAIRFAAAAFAAFVYLAPVGASAANRVVEIINETGQTMVEFYASVMSTNDWKKTFSATTRWRTASPLTSTSTTDRQVLVRFQGHIRERRGSREARRERLPDFHLPLHPLARAARSRAVVGQEFVVNTRSTGTSNDGGRVPGARGERDAALHGVRLRLAGGGQVGDDAVLQDGCERVVGHAHVFLEEAHRPLPVALHVGRRPQHRGEEPA